MTTGMTSHRAKGGGLLTLVLVAAMLGGACSSTPQICKDLSQLSSSVQALTDVHIGSGSLSTLQSKLSTVQTDLTAVKQSADQAIGPQVSAMDAAVQTLKQAIQAAVASPSAATISAVATAAKATETAFALKAAKPDC